MDKRSVAWDIAADVNSLSQAHAFAEGLTLQNNTESSQFFTKSASVIVAGVINSLNRTHPENWDLRRLILLTTDRNKLESVLVGSDLIQQYFSQPLAFANIQSTIAARMVGLKAVAALWKHAKRKISLREWLKATNSILILSNHISLHAPIQQINNLALRSISTALLSEPESPRLSRVWFFCDDLRAAGLLDALPALLNARSKGVRCVLSFQKIEGLKIYGNTAIPKDMLNRCTSVVHPRSLYLEWCKDRSRRMK